MSESIWDLSLSTALDQTASASPTPGGGSVAPVTAAFGLGLVLMSLEVSANKQPSSELAQALARGKQLLTELKAFADRDVAVFRAYMEALRLPKQTPEQQASRNAARAAASLAAAETPLRAAEVCLESLAYADQMAPAVHKSVLSDLLAGADILVGALKAALRTVDINLPTLNDERTRFGFAERAAFLEDRAAQLYENIVAAED
jgi:formiminotetrahydrofolate cyclodeaminase